MPVDFDKISILHWMPSDSHKCGYCGLEGSISNGLWAESLNVVDYQNMIDRGWRRSGKYCYKPIMAETCCPQYTIRCSALKFKPTKSQKKVIKKVNKYLREDSIAANRKGEIICDLKEPDEVDGIGNENNHGFVMPNNVKEIGDKSNLSNLSTSKEEGTTSSISTANSIECSASEQMIIDSETLNKSRVDKEVKKGVGADTSLPKCQKAKVVRQKRREEKLQKSAGGSSDMQTSSGRISNNVKPKLNFEKSLNDLIHCRSVETNHNIQVKLIRPKGADWEQYRNIEFELYKKYQVAIHRDPPGKCSIKSFENFLVESPLQDTNSVFGSYHQQYWLDNKLIAVGVIDILPKCVSSVYFFYDTDYNHLSLGIYSALRELEFTQYLHQTTASIQYYYMGFYIHSCSKMRYKGKLVPSELLCPETYAWTSINQCLPLLEVNKYSRLQAANVEDENFCTPEMLMDMKIAVDYTLYTVRLFKNKESYATSFSLLGKLLGKKLVKSVLVVF